MALAESSWNRESFARDLYLNDLVSRCLAVTVAGQQVTCVRYLTRVVGTPPRDVRDVETRRGVLCELSSSVRAREELESVYLGIVRLRTLLGTSRATAAKVRRMEILREARALFERLAASFEGAASALGRLRSFGRAVVESEAFRRLSAFLDHDDNQSSLDLRVRVGADGEVRAMDIVAVKENVENPFHVPVLRRFLTRIALFWRGYRTTSGEIAERLLSEMLTGIEDPVSMLFQVLGDAELLLGSLCFRIAQSGRGSRSPTLSFRRIRGSFSKGFSTRCSWLRASCPCHAM